MSNCLNRRVALPLSLPACRALLRRARLRGAAWMFAVLPALLAPLAAGAEEPMATAEARSPINGLLVQQPAAGEAYSFSVLGHLRGRRNSPYPSASFVLHLEDITRDAAFLVLLGDLVNHPDAYHFARFRESVVSRTSIPIFNAVGNHDVKDRVADGIVEDWLFNYRKEFGPTYYHFVVGRSMFVVIDTELAGHRIAGPQLDMLKRALATARDSEVIRNVFVFSHKLQWTYTKKELKTIWELGHGTFAGADFDFDETVEPLLVETAATRSVFWFSGDTGAFPEAPHLVFHKLPGHDVTYVAVGIGDLEHDAWIRVNVAPNADVSMQAISMAGRPVAPLESYDIAYWNARKAEALASRKLKVAAPQPSDKPLDVRLIRMFNNRTNWLVGGASALVFVVIGFLAGRRRRPRA